VVAANPSPAHLAATVVMKIPRATCSSERSMRSVQRQGDGMFMLEGISADPGCTMLPMSRVAYEPSCL
jgi:hypothetical protein